MKKKIKKVLALIFIIVAITTMFSLSVSAALLGLQYYVYEGNVVITGYKGVTKDLLIPAKIGGKKVVAIENVAFFDHNFESVSIPDTVTEIGSCAFGGCDKLTKITVDSNNKYFSNDDNGVLFNKDKSVVIQYPGGNKNKNYTIPDSVRTINEYSFAYSRYLEEIVIPDSVIEILPNSFVLSYELKKINIPGTVDMLGEEAFQMCDKLKDITIENGVRVLGFKSFDGCTSLENINLPDSVQLLDGCVFAGCARLKNITFGSGLKEIGYASFSDCDSLETVLLPDGLITVKHYAFQWCDGLKYVNFPDSVKEVSDCAFSNCTNLESVKFGKSVEVIGRDVFNGCNKLVEVYVHPENKAYYSDYNSVLYNKEITDLIFYPTNSTETLYEIPETVKKIGNHAFAYCNNLVNVIVPESVEFIEEFAFRKCTNLKSIVLPDSLITLSENAFYGCTGLEYVKTGNGVSKIGNSTFCGCTGLKNIDFGNSITVIDESAFYSCESLKEIMLPYSLTEIRCGAFSMCTSIKSVHLPSGVTIIEPGAFDSCFDLENFTVDEMNQCFSTDEYGVLYNKDKSLLIQYPIGAVRNSFIIPDTVEVIGEYAFNGYSGIDSITIPASVVEIESYAFYTQSWDAMIKDVYYSGTQQQWNEITIMYPNNSLEKATIHTAKENIGNDSENCSCNCHKGGISGFFFRIILFIQKLFKLNKTCSCGVVHY